MFITADTASIHVHEPIPRMDPTSIERFNRFPTPLIGDATGRLGLMDAGMKPLSSDARSAGPALTVLTREGDNLAIHCALDHANPGDILVINALGGQTRAVFGDLLAEICLARGVAGVVLDGLSRDAVAIRDLGLPVWCRGISPAGPFKHGPGAVGVAVACGGLVVHPGDLIVADSDGVAVVTPDHTEHVLLRLAELEQNEEVIRQKIRRSRLDMRLS